eukprot:TRINITY_DN6945_c0_g1_i1.p1 TRINITY_DN6945_c0_g1~~TRINITY_DN6945_c0_g1_i1.p1  ORF type:complete len:188 (+),score=33.20 TRINITY_DN6945_c0_g1_i1:75-638(+)
MQRNEHGLALMKSPMSVNASSSTGSLASDDSWSSRFSLRPCEEEPWTLDEVVAEHHEVHDLGICTPCALSASGKGCLMGWSCDYCHLPHDQLAKGGKASQRRRQERFRCRKELDELGEAVADEDLFQELLLRILQRRDAFTASRVKSKLRSLLRARQLPKSTLALAVCALKGLDEDVLHKNRTLISL